MADPFPPMAGSRAEYLGDPGDCWDGPAYPACRVDQYQCQYHRNNSRHIHSHNADSHSRHIRRKKLSQTHAHCQIPWYYMRPEARRREMPVESLTA